MKLFFHAKTLGFYSELMHGTRNISIPDSTWVRPEVEVDVPNWVARGEEAEETPRVKVPDMSADQPMVTAPNPDCTLPIDLELCEITVEFYNELMDSQSTSKFYIGADKNGAPISIPVPPPTTEQLQEADRSFRDRVLLATDSLVARHRDEAEVGDTTLTSTQYKALQVYRQNLRAWPDSKYFPDSTKRPTAPAWL